jgi:phage terminase large subunit
MDEFNVTSVFEKNTESFNNGASIIINKGGTRSSKTYSILQLLFIKALFSKKPLIISIVSYALPHLKLGAMRDFDKILLTYGMPPEKYKNISESNYKINKSIVEFFGVENIGKVHGPERDILYINECNYIKSYDIIRHLMVRTRATVFMDYNPTREFWIDTEIIGRRKCDIIHSTYLDNEHLTQRQIVEIESNKQNENWWRVYGLGLMGRLEDAILSNWEFGEFDETLPFIYGQDFGSKHHDALVKCAVNHNQKLIYWKEELYENGLSTDDLIVKLNSRVNKNSLILAESAAPRTIEDIRKKGFNIKPVVKNKVVDDIKALWGYKIIIDPTSYNLQKNLNNWVWLDKKGEVPIDTDDDLIDAGRYGTMIQIKARSKPAKFNVPKYH